MISVQQKAVANNLEMSGRGTEREWVVPPCKSNCQPLVSHTLGCSSFLQELHVASSPSSPFKLVNTPSAVLFIDSSITSMYPRNMSSCMRRDYFCCCQYRLFRSVFRYISHTSSMSNTILAHRSLRKVRFIVTISYCYSQRCRDLIYPALGMLHMGAVVCAERSRRPTAAGDYLYVQHAARRTVSVRQLSREHCDSVSRVGRVWKTIGGGRRR
jgi:hypothetical protein